MAKPWRFLPYDAGRVKDLGVQLAVSPILAQVLSARGYEDDGAARVFLNSKLNEKRSAKSQKIAVWIFLKQFSS